MDPERQPLLRSESPRCVHRRRCSHALTCEEVLQSQTLVWTRMRCALALVMWCALAAILSLVACVLVNADRCTNQMPSVPPVHLSFTPLVQSL